MATTPTIGYPVPVNFTIPLNGKVGITVNDYTQLIPHSKEYTVGSGKNQWTYAIVHTDAGYISLNLTKSGAQAEWMADHFTITAVYSDEKGNHSFSFEHDGKRSELPFQSIIPKNIDTSFYDKGIAINTQNKAHEAFSQYLQGLLHMFKVQDAKQLIGWNMKKGQLKWMGANHDPPLLKYHNSCGSEAAYIEQLGGLMSDCPPLQFVTCSAAASTLLAYLQLKLKIPVATFGISLKNSSSKGRYKTRTTRDKVPYYSYYFDMSKVKEQFDGEFELRFSSLVQRHEWDERTSFNIEYLDDSEALINGYNCKLNGQGRAFEGKLFLL